MGTTNFENISLNRKTLSFPPHIEKIFFLQGVASKASFLRTGILIFCCLGLFLQYYNFYGLLWIPSLLTLPLIVIFIVSKSRHHERFIDLFYCLTLFFSGMIVISLMASSGGEFLSFSALVFLMMISGFVFFKVRYLYSGVTTVLIIAIYGLSQIGLADVTARMIWHNIYFFSLITVVSMAAGYIIEYQTRMAFLSSAKLSQMLKQTRQKENLRNKELIRINKSLELEILAHTEAESQLRESEEKYRNLVVSLPEGIFIVQDGKIVFFNPSLEKLTGYDFGTLPGHIADGLAVDDKPKKDEFNPFFQDFFVRQDGQKVYIEKSCVEIVYNSRPAKLFSVRDVTEKVTATLEKKQLQKELDQAKKMEAFGILAGGVAHDLNNVLSGLVSTPDILLMDLPKDSPLIECVEVIKDSGKRAAVIVDEMLTMARSTQKRLEPLQINNVIEDYFISPEFEGLMKNHPDVEIVKELNPNLPFIQASSIHIRKTVMNLIANAVEAMEENRGRVFVKTCQVEFDHHKMKGYEKIENGNYLKFSVMDTGKGISKDDIEHIFEPFYSKKVLGRSGTGLGLSVVWNAVHDHQGYIHVNSQKGQTCFTLYFPISETHDKPAEQDKVYTLSDYSGNNERILVVDDMESQQKIAASILNRLGYNVAVVSSGEAAIEYAKDNNIDLVMLDMIMEQGINGFETFQQLLLIDPEIKAIITSGYSETEEVKKAQALGAGQFIKKPYSLQRIGLALKKELSNQET